MGPSCCFGASWVSLVAGVDSARPDSKHHRHEQMDAAKFHDLDTAKPPVTGSTLVAVDHGEGHTTVFELPEAPWPLSTSERQRTA